MKSALCILLVFNAVVPFIQSLPQSTSDDFFNEITSLFRAKARSEYSTKDEMIRSHSKFDMQTKENSYKHFGKSHSYVVKLDDNCKAKCQMEIARKFTKDRYTVIDENHVIIVASQAELDSYQQSHIDSIALKAVLHPDLKVAPEIRMISSGEDCNLPQTEGNEIKPKEFKVVLSITPLSKKELADFLVFASDLSTQYGNAFEFLFNRMENVHTEPMRATIRTVHCDKVLDIVNQFAQRREVSWMERSSDAYVHNRWARGVCETNDHTNAPLDLLPLNGTGQIVGVTDTGLDMSNCYFFDDRAPFQFQLSTDSLVTNPNHRKVIQYVYQPQTDKYDDGDTAHGTHVAGTVAGMADQNYGDFSEYRGMAHGARIAFFDIGLTGNLALKLPGTLDTGLFEKLYDGGARVITNSWGSPTDHSYNNWAMESDRFMRRFPDTLLLFSVGNTGVQGAGSVGTPSTAKNVAAVGASLNAHESWKAYTEPSISDDHNPSAVAYFSSRGPTVEGLMKPDFLAPGWYTTSAAGKENSNSYHCEVKALLGTSMAAPTAAGFAVKIREYFMRGFYPTGTENAADGFIPSGALLKAMLVHSGQKMTHVMRNTSESTPLSPNAYPSNVQGYGRIQMDKVLNFGESFSNPLTLAVVGGVSGGPHYSELTFTGQTKTHTFVPTTNDPVRITMCYTDLPGNTFIVGVMANKLSMSVRDGDGVTHQPYLIANAIPGTCQMVDLTGSEVKPEQTYSVDITASVFLVHSNTDLGLTQPYSLVITGPITYLSLTSPAAASAPEHSATYISSGAITYIVILAVIVALLFCIVYYFYRITKKSKDLLVDPSRGAWTGEGQPGAMGMVLRMRQRALDQKNQRTADEYEYQ